jgi:GNAT superfamily N-acetyltransferase
VKTQLQFESYKGPEIARVFEPLAMLRVAVFRAYPYLYEGTIDYERTYLQTYADAPRALLFAAFDEGRMVGATTCIPLADETQEVQAPFLAAGYDLSRIFYFGESILLPEYRGYGLGHRFFDEREAHARSFGTFTHTCFCAVQRPEDHPARPAAYRPLDEFWLKRGYQPVPGLQSTFSWPDLGETVATEKAMQYWSKALVY